MTVATLVAVADIGGGVVVGIVRVVGRSVSRHGSILGAQGYGSKVRVTFVRGLRRVVRSVDSSSSSVSTVGDALVAVALDSLVAVGDGEVDGDGSSGPPISVVWGGLVLVTVWVVVGVSTGGDVAENVGSTKFSGASSGSPKCRDM